MNLLLDTQTVATRNSVETSSRAVAMALLPGRGFNDRRHGGDRLSQLSQ